MKTVSSLIGEQVTVLLSGNQSLNGVLTDVGFDIYVLFDGMQYYYIPQLHVHWVRQNRDLDEHVDKPDDSSFAEEMETISYRKILMHAKGSFAEIYVTGNLTFHGYITNVLNDYFVFYSPVFKTMYISLSHLKWLAPYNQNITPYMLNHESLPVLPNVNPMQRSMEEQLKKAEGQLVVFDGGTNPMKIGLLQKVDNHVVELSIAEGESVFLQLHHIKSVHMP